MKVRELLVSLSRWNPEWKESRLYAIISQSTTFSFRILCLHGGEQKGMLPVCRRLMYMYIVWGWDWWRWQWVDSKMLLVAGQQYKKMDGLLIMARSYSTFHCYYYYCCCYYFFFRQCLLVLSVRPTQKISPLPGSGKARQCLNSRRPSWDHFKCWTGKCVLLSSPVHSRRTRNQIWAPLLLRKALVLAVVPNVSHLGTVGAVDANSRWSQPKQKHAKAPTTVLVLEAATATPAAVRRRRTARLNPSRIGCTATLRTECTTIVITVINALEIRIITSPIPTLILPTAPQSIIGRQPKPPLSSATAPPRRPPISINIVPP